jgi:heterotetrameric sarcosine oxidase gamma subunit
VSVAELSVETRHGFGLVAIMARKGVKANQIGDALGAVVPTSPARIAGGEGISLIGTGAGTWLAYRDGPPPFWEEELRERLEGLASVSDQSSAYAIVRISGLRARTILQRGAPIDLDPIVFRTGAAATTVISHIGAIIWQVDEQPTYEVATFRSYADSFRHWLDQTAAAH